MGVDVLNLLAVSDFNGFDWRDSAEYYDAVIRKYGKMLLENPRSPVFVSMANTCLKAGKLRMARDVIERGLKRRPNLVSAKVCKAHIFIDMGMYAEAREILMPIAQKMPENVLSRRLLAQVCLKTKDYSDGLKWLEEIKNVWPSYRPPERLHRELKAGLGGYDLEEAWEENGEEAGEEELEETLEETAEAAAAEILKEAMKTPANVAAWDETLSDYETEIMEAMKSLDFLYDEEPSEEATQEDTAGEQATNEKRKKAVDTLEKWLENAVKMTVKG